MSAHPRRHPCEIPLLVLTALVAAIIAVSALVTAADALVVGGMSVPPEVAFVALLPVIVYFVRGLLLAQQRVQGVRITATQFPQAHTMVVDAARHFGLTTVPDAYVVLGNGVINAFASGHGRRRYLIIYSDLFEVGGQARNPEALQFVIGHEVGHIAAGHTSFMRTLVIAFTSGIPVLGSAMSRAQEYTADNHGYSYCPEGAATCMGLLGVGKYLLGQVDFRALCDRAKAERGFFVWLVNLLASHPVLLWRAAALGDRTRSGRVFFRPSDTPPAPRLQAPTHPQPQPYGQVTAQYAAYGQASTITPAAPYRPPFGN